MDAITANPPGDHAVRGHNWAEVALGGIYEISKLLASTNRLEPTLSGVLALLSSYLDMRHGLIALIGKDDKADLVVGTGWSEANAARYFERMPERAIGRIIVTRMPLVIPDIAADSLFSDADIPEMVQDNNQTVSFIGVPIKLGETVAGTLTIDRAQEKGQQVPFDSDVRFLTMTANLVGQTLRLHRAVAQDRERLLEEQARLAKAHHIPEKPDDPPPTIEGIVGQSQALSAVIEKVRLVAPSNSPIMLRGETGTGKEMFANAIHHLSQRAGKPFIKLNCAALPESVLESELFGHEKGAFTGAIAQHRGRFEMADGGTLFLDEIGEISTFFQAKLLRVLQDGTFERVGGTKSISVNVRLICATNRDLESDVMAGKFRADLYYRIAVVPIFLPPLRERRDDIPLLAREFLHRFNAEHGTELSFSASALCIMRDCFFPGNVRELENCVRHTASLAHTKDITEIDFACQNGVCLSAMLWRGRGGARNGAEHACGCAPDPSGNGCATGNGNSIGTGTQTAPGFPPILPAQPAQSGRETQPEIRPPTGPLNNPMSGPMTATPHYPEAPAPVSGGYSAAPPPPVRTPVADPNDPSLPEEERLIAAMERAGWVQAKAARILGLTPRQIGYALRKHGITLKKF